MSAAVLKSCQEAVEAVLRIAPRIREQCDQTEANRLVDPGIIRLLEQAGLFGVLGSRAFGGSEIGVEALVRVTIEIASCCGSTGWVYGVLAGHSWLLNLFPPEAQREASESANTLTATVFRLGGSARKVDGGYRLQGGQGRFSSGIDHVGWIMVGNNVLLEDGKTEQRFLLIPRSEVKVIDDWHTLGMRGTGSRSIEIPDSFIPEHRTLSVADLNAGKAPGASFHKRPFYQLGLADVVVYSVAAAPLGMARAALQCAAEDFRRASAKGPRPYQDAFFGKFGKAAADIDAAINLVLADAARLDRLADSNTLDETARRELQRNGSWAVQTCRDAVNELYKLAGGTVIYDSSALQRIWRDINSAAQHTGLSEDRAMIDYARSRLGLPPEAFVIKTARD
jgi:alkylation response protein AidB-like acyl-CoA dehydrogenase